MSVVIPVRGDASDIPSVSGPDDAVQPCDVTAASRMGEAAQPDIEPGMLVAFHPSAGEDFV
jgi:hypothetical protein